MELKKSFNEALEFNKKRLIFGIALAIIEFIICLWLKAPYILTVVYPLATIAVSPWKIKTNNPVSYLLKIIVAGLYAFGTLICSQILVDADMKIIRLFMVAANIICFAALASLIFIFINNARVSMIISAFIFNLLSTANYFVYSFRTVQLSPSDFFKIGTAMNVADNYQLSVTFKLIVGWVLFIILSAALFAFDNFKCKHKIIGRTAALGIFAALCGCIVIVCLNVRQQHWLNYGARMNGYPATFVMGLKELTVEKPENYDSKNVDEIASKYTDDVTPNNGKKPDIFVIMNESFADFNVLGDNFKTNQEVTPYFNSIKDNVIRGYALSSVYGGNTANSEYEFLTGNSMAFFPENTLPYQQYIGTYQYSLIQNLKKNGYECSATHPYLASGWSRPTIYPLLGFDHISFIDSYPQKNMIREFVSDQEMYEELISRYESRDKSTPQFTFGITMQNHGNYTYDGDNFTPTIKLDGFSKDYPDAEQYLTLIHESDKALKYLIDYFSKSEDPVVLVFFGDHLPNLNQDFYKEIHGGNFNGLDEQILLNKIPFMVWANYEIDTKTDEFTSINYLSEYLYDITGISKPTYSQALSDLQKNIPIINAKGYYSNSEHKFLEFDKAKDAEKTAINNYAQMTYNSIFDEKNRNKTLFPDIK